MPGSRRSASRRVTGGARRPPADRPCSACSTQTPAHPAPADPRGDHETRTTAGCTRGPRGWHPSPAATAHRASPSPGSSTPPCDRSDGRDRYAGPPSTRGAQSVVACRAGGRTRRRQQEPADSEADRSSCRRQTYRVKQESGNATTSYSVVTRFLVSCFRRFGLEVQLDADEVALEGAVGRGPTDQEICDDPPRYPANTVVSGTGEYCNRIS